MARYLDIHPVDPQARLITQAAEIVREGGLIAYPTDSGYALGCSLGNQDGKDRISSIRRLDDRHHYTLVCSSFAQLGQFVIIDNSVFRAIKAATPGPYTFILPATKEVPRRLLHPKKKTVGVRLPDHKVVAALLAELGEPLLSSTCSYRTRTCRSQRAGSSTTRSASWSTRSSTATAARSRRPWSTSPRVRR